MRACKRMGQNIPGHRNSKCKGPEVGNCLLCWGQVMFGAVEVSREYRWHTALKGTVRNLVLS